MADIPGDVMDMAHGLGQHRHVRWRREQGELRMALSTGCYDGSAMMMLAGARVGEHQE